MDISEAMWECHRNSMEHGWWDEIEDQNVPTKLALIHSEISEALEDFRTNRLRMYSDPSGHLSGFPTELADAIIRILDLCGWLGIDIEDALAQKMAYNKTRPRRHGGKRC